MLLLDPTSLSNNLFIGAIYLRRSPYSHRATRNFTKIGYIISFTGGIAEFILLIVGIFMRFYNKYSFLNSLCNHSYYFMEEVNKPYLNVLGL